MPGATARLHSWSSPRSRGSFPVTRSAGFWAAVVPALAGAVMAARIRNALALLRPLTTVDGVQLRLHGAILYNSIYRADSEALINTHIFGIPAPSAPVLHLRAANDATMFTTYMDSFEHTWTSAQ